LHTEAKKLCHLPVINSTYWVVAAA